ncbi:MAG TPA: N-acetylmuramoyl-L-alanine amidase [Myxococcota bacterium]|jgi:N-acetyl-anhydromuramyl-L-alanine amidase AmpD|nr:N-acetylmuramoyl-L-alanine amidase [Myxococcota bacterium]
MDITFDQAGWASTAVKHEMAPRPDQNGVQFTPVTPGLHGDMNAKYGGPRGLTIHCTDVVVPDAGAFARRTARSSPRRSSYNFLIGLDGDLHQLCSIRDRAWHAGRASTFYAEIAAKKTLRGKKVSAGTIQKVARVYSGKTGRWVWPVVDGVAVQNPNNWGPGIEIMGKAGQPLPAQELTLRALVQALFVQSPIRADAVWSHGALDPLNRHDPGFDVAAWVADANAWELREGDGWNGEGGPE